MDRERAYLLSATTSLYLMLLLRMGVRHRTVSDLVLSSL
jgi:hypothetical protein